MMQFNTPAEWNGVFPRVNALAVDDNGYIYNAASRRAPLGRFEYERNEVYGADYNNYMRRPIAYIVRKADHMELYANSGRPSPVPFLYIRAGRCYTSGEWHRLFGGSGSGNVGSGSGNNISRGGNVGSGRSGNVGSRSTVGSLSSVSNVGNGSSAGKAGVGSGAAKSSGAKQTENKTAGTAIGFIVFAYIMIVIITRMTNNPTLQSFLDTTVLMPGLYVAAAIAGAVLYDKRTWLKLADFSLPADVAAQCKRSAHGRALLGALAVLACWIPSVKLLGVFVFSFSKLFLPSLLVAYIFIYFLQRNILLLERSSGRTA